MKADFHRLFMTKGVYITLGIWLLTTLTAVFIDFSQSNLAGEELFFYLIEDAENVLVFNYHCLFLL